MINSFPFLPEFWSSLVIELSVLIFTLVCGLILISLFKRETLTAVKDFSEIFLSLFLGIVVIGVFTAVVITRGNTIFVLAPLFLGLYYWITRTSAKHIAGRLKPLNLQPGFWIPLLLAVNVLAFSLTWYFLIIKTNGGINCDQVFYGQVSYSLGNSGIETTNFSWFRESINLNPYHYLELWYVSFTQKIFNLGPGAYVLVWYPVSITLVFLGIALLTQTICDEILLANQKIIYIISGTLFFFILTPGNRFFLGSNNLDDLKTALATSLFILIYYTFFTKGIYSALCVSLSVIFIYSPLTPAIYSGILFVTLYLMIINKDKFETSSLLLISGAAVFVALFLGFYYFNGFFSSNIINSTGIRNQFFSGIVINLFIQLGGDFLRLIFYFIPVFFITILISVLTRSLIIKDRLIQFLRKEKVILIFIFSGIFFSKIVSLIIEKFNPDGFQVYSLFYNKLVPLSLFIIIIYLIISYLKSYRVFFISTIFLIFIYFSWILINSPSPHFFKPASDKFDPAFWSEIYRTVIKDDRKFVFVPNDNVEKNDFEKNNLLVYPLQRMIWIKNNYFPLNLSIVTGLINRKSSEGYGLFHNEMTRENEENKQTSLLSFRQEFNFVSKNKIGFIILENGAYLDPRWEEFITKRISGEKYSVLCLNSI
jgi:hypothetical protein